MARLKLRTFIALPLDERVRRHIVSLQEELGREQVNVKWVEPENLHVTLLFLGEIDARELPDLCKAVRGVTSELDSFAVEVAGVGCFPNPRRPRTLWIGISDGRAEVVELHDRIEDALLRLGAYRREERGFTPHVTLGRVKSDDGGGPLRDRLKEQSDWSAGRQEVREVHVMSSETGPKGPTYTVLSREKLRPGGPAVE